MGSQLAGSTSNPDDIPSDGDGASTHPGGEPSGNPLDPVVRPGVDLSQMPHTGTHPPEHGEVPPHVAAVEPSDETDERDDEAAPVGHVSADEQPGSHGQDEQDADPADTPGLEPGGGVEPGDTPPSAGGTATSLAKDKSEKGGRSRLLVPIGILVVLALLFVAFFLGQLIGFF